MRERIVALYAKLDTLDWLWRLVVRVVVALIFIDSAVLAFHDLPGTVEFFRKLGVPAPEIQAPVINGIEILAGAGVLVGLLTRPAAVALCGIMVVALATDGIAKLHASHGGFFDFIYLPDFLQLLLLAGLVCRGAGKASLDAVLAKKRAPASTAPASSQSA